MTFALPVFVTDNTQPAAGCVRLPAQVAGAAFAGGVVALPVLVTGAALAGGAIVLPALLTTFLSFSMVGSGSVVVGGSASIVGDPDVVPSGGVRIGGASTVSEVVVQVFELYPRGGAVLSGAATVSFNWTTFVPAGGVRVAGVGTVSSFTTPSFAPSGGVAIGGEAANAMLVVYPEDARTETEYGVGVGGAATVQENITVVPTGGVYIGGNPVILERIRFSPSGGILVGGTSLPTSSFIITPSGGVTIGGSATRQYTYACPVNGGVSVGGSAVSTDKQAWFAPSGGIAVGGASTAYMLPAGYVATPENPYNQPYAGWAFNYDTYAASRYTDVPANSIWTFNGVTYIANEGGIYALDAATDQGRAINASFSMAKIDFAESKDKKVPVVYVAAVTNTRLRTRVVVNQLDPSYYVFNDDRAKLGAVRGMRTTTGKALSGRYWQFTFENINGADFEIDSVELNPVVLARRGA